MHRVVVFPVTDILSMRLFAHIHSNASPWHRNLTGKVACSPKCLAHMPIS
jgi:hypothetical protein